MEVAKIVIDSEPARHLLPLSRLRERARGEGKLIIPLLMVH